MFRVELFILIGIAIGMVLGVVGSHLVRKYLSWRDRRLVRVRIKENLDKVDTDELLEELSGRDDLSFINSKKKENN